MIKERIQKLFRSVGIEIDKTSIYSSNRALLKRCLDYLQIDLVVDVGANVGQYGMSLRESGYNRDIVSFEPLKDVFRVLSHNTKKYRNWRALNLGIGSSESEMTINIARNLESSSFLKVTELSVMAAPESGFSNSDKVQVVTLNKALGGISNDYQNLFVKIDVQGFEIEVLKGIGELLPRIKAIQIEMSFVPLYESGPLYREILEWMEGIGFEIYTILPDFRDPQSGRMLQADGIFIKK